MKKILSRILMMCIMLVTCFTCTLSVDAATVVPKTSITSLSEGTSTITVKWKKPTKAINGYHIQRATNAKFTGTIKEYYISSAKTTQKKMTGLTGNKTYYVRIRTYKNVKVNGVNKKTYSGWSTVKNVKTLSGKYQSLTVGKNCTTGKYKVEITKKRNLYYYVNNTKKPLVKSNVYDATVCGSKVYYMTDGNTTDKFYCLNLKTGKNTLVASKNAECTYSGYYNGYIYYQILNKHSLHAEKTYKIKVTTGTATLINKLKNVAIVEQSGMYFWVEENRSDVSSVKLWRYNLSTGYLKQFATNLIYGQLIDHTLYYCEVKGAMNGNAKVLVFNKIAYGKNTKVQLGKDFVLPKESNGYAFTLVEKDYALIETWCSDIEDNKYFKYTYATNKTEESSYDEFWDLYWKLFR